MEPFKIQDVQQQLVHCQNALDQARLDGWDPDLVLAFEEATRILHEGAIVRRHLASNSMFAPPPEVPGETTEAQPLAAPKNRLLEPPEDEELAPKNQVDLISSIGELTLAEKLALKPLQTVAEGMSILDRAQFTSVLFSGEEEIFGTLLGKLERASTQEEALSLFQEALATSGDAEEIEELKESFAKRIMRTFVS